MLFTDTVFLFVFFPLILMLYYCPIWKSRIEVKNIILFWGSMFFYAWGEPVYVFLMLISLVFTYCIGVLISGGDCPKTQIAQKFLPLVMENRSKYQCNSHFTVENSNKNGIESHRSLVFGQSGGYRRNLLLLGVGYHIFVLFIFKYLVFVISEINNVFGIHLVIGESISLPIGISFYTFQMISYIVDVYRDSKKAQRKFLNLGLYVALFPQLIAGPIVRYSTIEKEIHERKENIIDFTSGIRLFVIGLGKKALLADYLALISDNIFFLNNISRVSMVSAWIGAIAYTLEIYFDFSGYSDMAIGLGRCFGFHFNSNFNQPYCAVSINDFWKRWHISLTDWFRDYVYIPLGGNRCSPSRHVINIIIVWLLTGIWHGANWTFLVWGIVYCCFQLFEKYLYNPSKWPIWISRIYTLLIVCLCWVIFKSDSLNDACLYFLSMINIKNFVDLTAIKYLKSSVLIIALSMFMCTPLMAKLLGIDNLIIKISKYVFLWAILVLATILSISGGYSPFIYFNF